MPDQTPAGVAKHAWLCRMLRDEIRGGRIHPHEPLPPERELAKDFGVSRMTVRQALRSLTDDALIYSVRGVGTFVAEPKVAKDLALSSFSEDMRARGLTPSAEVLDVGETDSDTAVAAELGIEPGATVFRLERLRLADHVPLAHEQVYLPARLFPGLTDADLTGSLYELMDRRYGIRVDRAEQTTRAVNLGERLGNLLRVTARTAALHVRRISRDEKARVVERTDTLYRGDRYSFSATIQRPRG